MVFNIAMILVLEDILEMNDQLKDLIKTKVYKCSFCGQLATEEIPLVSTPKVSICKVCVELASEILNSKDKKVFKRINLDKKGKP